MNSHQIFQNDDSVVIGSAPAAVFLSDNDDKYSVVVATAPIAFSYDDNDDDDNDDFVDADFDPAGSFSLLDNDDDDNDNDAVIDYDNGKYYNDDRNNSAL